MTKGNWSKNNTYATFVKCKNKENILSSLKQQQKNQHNNIKPVCYLQRAKMKQGATPVPHKFRKQNIVQLYSV